MIMESLDMVLVMVMVMMTTTMFKSIVRSAQEIGAQDGCAGGQVNDHFSSTLPDPGSLLGSN